MFANKPHNSVGVVYRPSGVKGVNKVLVADYLPRYLRHVEKPRARLAGGGSKPGEDPIATGKRELKEETGLKVKTNAKMILIYSVSKKGHQKNGFLIARSDCKGAIRFRNPPRDRKIKFVGYRWLTFDQALAEIVPVPGFRSQHDILLAARAELIKMGLEYPPSPPEA